MTGKSKKAGKKELSEEDIAFQKKQAEDMKAMKGTEHLCSRWPPSRAFDTYMFCSRCPEAEEEVSAS